MLLIYPPLAKPGEPPAGIAQLAGSLKSHDLHCDILDLNIEGIHHLLTNSIEPEDTWSRRALKNLSQNIAAVKSLGLYGNLAQYRKCVQELNRVLEIQATENVSASLTNYQDSTLSPLKSDDLLSIAAHPEQSLFFHFFRSRLEKILDNHNYRYIGISLTYLSQALNSFALAGVIKQLAPHTKILVGGGLMTSWMRNGQWRNPFSGLIDQCIDGCGEEILLSLEGKKKSIEVKPDFTQLLHNEYLSPGFVLPYGSSSGCFWNKCSFCPENAERNRFCAKKPERVISELNGLISQYQPVLVHFLDNAIPPAVLERLTAKPLPIPWYGFSRISHHLLDPDFCRALKKSGCIMLKLGIESGSQVVLDSMQKGITAESASQVLRNLKNAGIATYVYLLFGTPAESRKEAKETLLFVRDHHDEISFLNLAIFNMPTNSIDNVQVETSTFYSGDLTLYTDFKHPRGWGRKYVRKFLDQEFRRVPEIAKILQNDPPFFTSNHAPFFSNFPSR